MVNCMNEIFGSETVNISMRNNFPNLQAVNDGNENLRVKWQFSLAFNLRFNKTSERCFGSHFAYVSKMC